MRRTAHGLPFSTQLWTPPTPPQDDSDVYVDPVVCLTYEATPIPESKLPPVYVRRERRRHKTDPSGAHPPATPPRHHVTVLCSREQGGAFPPQPRLAVKQEQALPGTAVTGLRVAPAPSLGGRLPDRCAEPPLCSAAGRKKKQRHGEVVVPPRSLFDRATPGLLKMRREGKEQKKNILLKQQTQFAKPLPTFAKPATESGPDNPEWLVSEDWALLQVSARAPAGRVRVLQAAVPHATSPSFRPRWRQDPDSAQRADLVPDLGPLGREAAAGAASEPHYRVPGPHAQLGPRQRCCQLLQPHLPLFQAVPEPLRERAHSQGGGEGERAQRRPGPCMRGVGVRLPWPRLVRAGVPRPAIAPTQSVRFVTWRILCHLLPPGTVRCLALPPSLLRRVSRQECL